MALAFAGGGKPLHLILRKISRSMREMPLVINVSHHMTKLLYLFFFFLKFLFDVQLRRASRVAAVYHLNSFDLCLRCHNAKSARQCRHLLAEQSSLSSMNSGVSNLAAWTFEQYRKRNRNQALLEFGSKKKRGLQGPLGFSSWGLKLPSSLTKHIRPNEVFFFFLLNSLFKVGNIASQI